MTVLQKLLTRLREDGGRYLLSVGLTPDETAAAEKPTFGGKPTRRWLTDEEYAALCSLGSRDETPAERGWLIELGGLGAPVYWCPIPDWRSDCGGFEPDTSIAVRFARKADAERVLAFMIAKPLLTNATRGQCFVSEHEWGPPQVKTGAAQRSSTDHLVDLANLLREARRDWITDTEWVGDQYGGGVMQPTGEARRAFGARIDAALSELDKDDPVSYDIEEAIRIAALWRAGKLLGADQDGVREALLTEVERLRAEKSA